MSVRFAPSPTGSFHVGNLRTAWISHAFSRALGLPWVVRFEDIDRPRVVPGSREAQLSDLKTLGMIPDEIRIQSENFARHESLFRQAVTLGQVYPCTCSRKELGQEFQSIASAPHGDTPLYTGRCRAKKASPRASHPTLAWRFKNPEDTSGKQDFVVARTAPDGSDFAPSYHWACAIDDFDGDHRLLVRASDLTQAAKLQARVHAWVALQAGAIRPYPAVFHASLVTSDDGGRLEKRTRGVTLNELLERGVSADQLLRKFETSFERSLIAGFKPGKIWSERNERISLSGLCLSVL